LIAPDVRHAYGQIRYGLAAMEDSHRLSGRIEHADQAATDESRSADYQNTHYLLFLEALPSYICDHRYSLRILSLTFSGASGCCQRIRMLQVKKAGGSLSGFRGARDIHAHPQDRRHRSWYDE
jgi:hypothetical protein